MGIESHLESPLAEAVRKVGSQSAFARLVKKSQASVYQLLARDGLIWPESVLIVEETTGISRHRLRPDVYGAAPAVTSKAHPSTGDIEIAR